MKYYSISETSSTFKLALPIIFGLIGQRLLEVSDAAMIGRIGDGVVPLAAAAFGGMLFTLIVIVGFGICIPVHVLVSQSKDFEQMTRNSLILNMNLWVALIYAIGLAVFIYLSVDLLDYFGQDVEVSMAAKPYIQFLGWSLIPFLLFQCFKNYAEALHYPWMPLLISLFGIAFNIFLNWVFIFGNLGVQPMGLKGAGLATFLARWVMFFLLAGIVISNKQFTTNLSVFRFLDWKNPLLKKIIKIGIPSAFQILFELGILIFATIMAGWVGKTVLAAHNITLSISALPLMFPLGVASAITIKIGAAVEKHDMAKVRSVIISVMTTTFIMSGLLTLVLFFLKDSLSELFIKERSTVSLAKDYLSFGAFLCLPYSLYIMCLGSLRGFDDTRTPSIMLFFAYCINGPLAMYALTFVLGWAGTGVWTGLILSFFAGAIALLLRLYWQLKKQAMPIDSQI